jgi:hypothetical protein
MKNIFTTLAVAVLFALNINFAVAKDFSGYVYYQEDPSRPIPNTIVILTNQDNGSYTTSIANSQGIYYFYNVPDGNYTLTGNATLIAGGVTAYDPNLLYLYLTASYSLTELQKLASDVDGNGELNWDDYNMIMDHILTGNPFPVGKWVFEKKEFVLNSYKDGVPHGMGGSCSGDVAGTFVPTVNHAEAIFSSQQLDMKAAAGDVFSAKISTISDLQFTSTGIIINYPEEMINITSVEFNGANFRYQVANGQIRLIWGNPDATPVNLTSGDAIITINGNTTSSFVKGTVAGFSIDGNTSFVGTDNQEIKGVQIVTPVITFGEQKLSAYNYPNPCKGNTTFNISSPVAGNAYIQIANANGKNVMQVEAGQISKGTVQIPADLSTLAEGYYSCSIVVVTNEGEQKTTSRLLITK